MKLPKKEYDDLKASMKELINSLNNNKVGLKIETKATELRKEFQESLEPIFSKINDNAIATAGLTEKVSLLCKIVIGAIIVIIGSIGTTILTLLK